MTERSCYFLHNAMTGHDLETLAATPIVSPEHEADGRRRRGNETRESILQAAADVASVHGLDGLTIGRLATELGMSKSGLFAHFGSKEELQLATIDAASRRFVERVIRPSREMPRGRARLEALLTDWLGYFRDEVFEGGCFFHTIKAEFDSRAESPVRARVIEYVQQFYGLLVSEARKAQEVGDLDASLDAEQLAFELDALGSAANQHFQLMRDPSAFERARMAIHERLDSVSVA
jgi:AcrR family transcriptional regulator